MEEELINEEKERFPIQIENTEVLDLIKKAQGMEWIAQYHMNKYRGIIEKIWSILGELHSLDFKNHLYTMASEIPTIYYVKPIQEQHIKHYESPSDKAQLI